MAVDVAPPLPLEHTPLLHSTLLPKPHYHATMSKLTIVIPERPASRVSQVLPKPQLGEPTQSPGGRLATAAVADDVDEDSNPPRSSDSSRSSCTCDILSPLSTHCEYCVRNGLDHQARRDSRRERDWMATMEEGRLYTSFSPYPEEQQRRGAWIRCTENEEMLAFLEFMIELQMRLLAVAVPTSLWFILVFVWYENNLA